MQHVHGRSEALRAAGIAIPRWKIHPPGGNEWKIDDAGTASRNSRQEGKIDLDRLERKHDSRFCPVIPHLEPLPGANQLMRHLSRHGIRFAIASTGGQEQTSLLLKRLALPAGTPIVTGDDVEKAKPSPRLFARGGRSSQNRNSQLHRGRRQRVGPARCRSEERLLRRIFVGRLRAGGTGTRWCISCQS
jgi:beta-phosphoglucomutase-like phosphatase (HAD superfamily)